MSKGRLVAARQGRLSRWLLVTTAAIAATGIGCAQRRQGLLSGPPKTASARPEPGLRVQAPQVDVKVADADEVEAGGEVKTAKKPRAFSSRVGLFRSSSTPSGRSLVVQPPLN